MSIQQPPQVSPDGKFYWNGTAWLPLPGQALPPAAPTKTSNVTGLTVVSIIIVFVLVLAVSMCGHGFQVTVATWSHGSADVTGSITNNTGAACSDPEITLHLRDHNGAIVREFSFGAGELAVNQTRKWTTHMIGFLSDAPVEGSVTVIEADATCADQH